MTDPDSTAALEQAKAAIEVKAAEAAAAKAQRELVEAESPLAKAQREAEAQKGIDEANQQSAEARQKQLSALIPDLSKVTSAPLEVKGDTPVFGPALTQRATAAAASGVGARVKQRLGENLGSARILITSETTLATSDAIYGEVLSGIKSLLVAAERLLGDLEPHPVLPLSPDELSRATFAIPQDIVGTFAAPLILPAVKALASALPGALSLLSAHRTLSTSPTTADSFAAAAVVAGDLARQQPGLAVFHDDFRLLPTGGVVEREAAALGDKREELAVLKRSLEDRKARESASVGEVKGAVKETEERLKEAKREDREALREKLERQQVEIGAAEIGVAECATRIAMIDSATGAIDSFTTSVRTTAEGAERSPLAAAILREQLHGDCGDSGRFTHVLLVKAEPGSAQQVVDDRLLWLKDKFSTVVTTSVTYMLIETGEGSVLPAGSVGGQAEINGTVGKNVAVVDAKSMSTS